MWITHEVFNQTPPLPDINLLTGDRPLHDAMLREGAAAHLDTLTAYGAQLGKVELRQLAEQANRHAPTLATHDAQGHRVDRVDFHPAWHRMLALLYRHGVHASAWLDPTPGAHVARAAAFYLHGQVEAGSLCPVTMTFAALPVLRREPVLFARLAAGFRSRDYDPRDLPLAQKHSLTLGMGLTEKQGGSDLRGITTHARPLSVAGRGRDYALVGHKWFFSAPSADAHLVLACCDSGPSCFFVPRWRDDGQRNGIRPQRLKDKLGNRANASAEVEFHDAIGTLVGEPGRGIATLVEVAAQTRLDCVLGSAALMRRALLEAVHHARHRSAFGRPLIQQPLMRNVIADLALESKAAMMLALHLAAAADQDTTAPAGGAPLARAWRRIVTPAAKFWICKRATAFIAECMEVLGGNGYIEEAPLARLLREAPVNSIWEGSGNVMCLDVLRALAREPEAARLLFDALATTLADDAPARNALRHLQMYSQADDGQAQWHARTLASQLTVLAQASLLRQHAPTDIADAFIATRLAQPAGQVAGLLDDTAAVGRLIDRL